MSLLFLVVSAAVFAVAQLTDPENVRFLAFDTAALPQRWYAIVTYGFVHVDWNHIIARQTAGIGFSAAAAAILFYYHVAFPWKRELPLGVPNVVLPIVLGTGSAAAIVFGWFPAIGHYPHLAGALVGVIGLGLFRRDHRPLPDDPDESS